MNNFTKRTLFGALYVAAVVAACLWGAPYFFGALFAVLAVMSVREFLVITHTDRLIRVEGMVLAFLLFVSLWGGSLFLTVTDSTTAAPLIRSISHYTFFLWLFLALVSVIVELFHKAPNPIENWGLLFSSQMMVALPFGLMNVLLAHSGWLLLSLFILIWLNDTGAYCFGSLLGKHKMFPRVSPGKTWEGLIGGAVVALAAGYFLLADPCHLTGLEFSLFQALLLSLLVVVFGTLGDLTESLLKRTLGIKDSGLFLPGHGGFLDRFDSVLMASFAWSLALLLFAIL